MLMRMLVLAPYKALEKKTKMKGKEAKSGLRHKGTSDATSGDTKAPSHEGDEDEEEEESNSPLKGGGRKKGWPLQTQERRHPRGRK